MIANAKTKRCFELTKRLKGCFYSKETYNLLNYLTLDIKDPVIRKKFHDQRCMNFKSLFAPVVSLIVIFMIIQAPWYWTDMIDGVFL
jgi:hypothetical protein